MVRSELGHEEIYDARSSREKKERDRDDERDRDRERDREREKVRDREKKERGREKDKVRDREREKDKARDREKDRLREKDRDRDRDRERERDRERDREEKEREWSRDRERDRDDEERDWSRDREKDRDDKEERERDRDRKEKDRERVREGSKDLEKEKEKIRDLDAKYKDKDDKRKDRGKDRGKEEDRGKDRGKEADIRRDADLPKERKKDKGDRDAGKEKEREKEKERDKDREKDRDCENERDREKEKGKEKDLEKERERHKERDGDNRHEKERDQEWQKEQEKSPDLDVENIPKDVEKRPGQESRKGAGSEIAAWVNKSRSLEEQKKIEERIKAARMARLLSEQDSGGDSEDEDNPAYSGKDLAGLKVLHGIDKVMEGGAVVLTLRDKAILGKDDVNDEADELENFEISQQLNRDKAYKDAKKKPGIYEDKFQNDINAVRTILPQYDDEMEDGMTLDESGGINEEGHKRLEELRKKLQGVEQKAHESLSGSLSVASDFYTQEEMLQFNKPKKKKRLRKKEVLDLDAMEAEAKAEGLGDADLGSRSSGVKQAQKLEKEKAAEEARKSAYLNAYTKAVDASQKLRLGSVMNMGGEDAVVFGGEEDDELQRSLQRARQAALKKQSENGGSSTGPQAVASALQQASEMEIEVGHVDDGGERDKTSVVFTETEEFCRNIQLDEILMRRPGAKDVFAEDDEPGEEEKSHGLDGGWMEVNEDNKDHKMEENQTEEDSSREEAVSEVSVGKGLAGALQLLKDWGTLKETVEWGGRNMDKKKSKLVGIVDQEEKFKNRVILLERVDEFGRVMTPKEAFRKLSHKFHGKGPGKMKQEKRMKQYEEEMKLKQMSSGDTPLMSMEKMRDAQAKLHTPYLVISGHIQPGQTSDPGSGFATMDKESIGSLTPMLGDQKVEYFLGIKRKPEGGSMRPPLPKKPKTDK